MRILSKIKNLNTGLKFLIIVLFVYLFLMIFNFSVIFESLNGFIVLVKKILPSLISAFVLIYVFNYFLTDDKIKRYLSSTISFKEYFLAAILGILSAGPIYAWYPFLADLKEKGLDNGLITIFLYNRAIKLPLLPVIIYYFSLKFVLIITILMIIFSLINGLIVKKLLSKPNRPLVKI